ncbi:hypothetical protein FKW77_000366 [Venturia effusa]|uniref:Histone-lysine N-methyltransferase, H3 lysine-36 specific n=1 Tax=Venturia effusa TaxID=50376 RepID=A0A517LM18_9PEZI|nr:hypothetical protein FKW77_000366 [Venturia effusa]
MSSSDVEIEEDIKSDVAKLKLEGTATSVEGELTLNMLRSIPSPSATSTPGSDLRTSKNLRSDMQSAPKAESGSQTPVDKRETTVSGEISVKLEPGRPPKLTRNASQKVVSRAPPLFTDEPDVYDEATKTFEVLPACTYAAKWLGSTEHAMDCDCRELWEDGKNNACDEESDCINRLTKIECTGHGSCGKKCQNRRFKNQEYADVSVFKTEKKGYGLRANKPLSHGDFIFEYIGEVIDEPRFRRRMRQYDEEGVKHFYFMSLNKGEFVDATKKGNLGRFCNHSCNPNAYVDKWVVGDKLCMGIFAGRDVKAGEELVFNYNVDRYGANPQPCYCGEANCTGFIGGKTQTEKATKLSDATIEALGIEDGDSWETATAKRPKKAKKKDGEDDEEYVNKIQPKTLEEDSVTNLMATLMQCKEKWIAVKLLSRIQQAEEEKVIHRILRMHGYRTLKIVLNEFKDDANVCLQVFDVLFKFPRLSRNKIETSGIETTIKELQKSDDERVVEQADKILVEWAKLTMEYRIPRMKRDPNAAPEPARVERRVRSRSRSRSRSKSPPTAPSGPRSSMPQRAAPFFGGPRPPPFRRPPPPPSQLPPGWFSAVDVAGKTYFYSAAGATQWTRPSEPAIQPPPPPKILSAEEKLQLIIDGCKNSMPNGTSAAATPRQEEVTPKKDKDRWRSYPIEKQKKIYESTLFPHIKPILDKFKHKLPRDDLKRLAKEVAKKMVESDYKNKRVSDPRKMGDKQIKAAKKYVLDYMNKAVHKKREHDKKKLAREEEKARDEAAKKPNGTTTPLPVSGSPVGDNDEEEDMDIEMSDDEEADNTASDMAPKRKRDGETPATPLDDDDATVGAAKRLKTEEEATPPPPPPPPPPAEDYPEDGSATPTQEPSPVESETRVYEEVKAANGNGTTSPVQLATPSTNGSYEQESKIKGQSKPVTNGSL